MVSDTLCPAAHIFLYFNQSRPADQKGTMYYRKLGERCGPAGLGPWEVGAIGGILELHIGGPRFGAEIGTVCRISGLLIVAGYRGRISGLISGLYLAGMGSRFKPLKAVQIAPITSNYD